MGASITYCRVHLQAIASHLPDTPMMVYGTGRWAHFNVKLHFFNSPMHTKWNSHLYFILLSTLLFKKSRTMANVKYSTVDIHKEKSLQLAFLVRKLSRVQLHPSISQWGSETTSRLTKHYFTPLPPNNKRLFKQETTMIMNQIGQSDSL